MDESAQLVGAAVDEALADPQNWLWVDEGLSLVTVSLTDVGVSYL